MMKMVVLIESDVCILFTFKFLFICDPFDSKSALIQVMNCDQIGLNQWQLSSVMSYVVNELKKK